MAELNEMVQYLEYGAMKLNEKHKRGDPEQSIRE